MMYNDEMTVYIITCNIHIRKRDNVPAYYVHAYYATPDQSSSGEHLAAPHSTHMNMHKAYVL